MAPGDNRDGRDRDGGVQQRDGGRQHVVTLFVSFRVMQLFGNLAFEVLAFRANGSALVFVFSSLAVEFLSKAPALRRSDLI